MERLKVFEGVPPPYDVKKRVVVPQALRVLRLKPGRKYCTVGRLGQEFGWKYQDVVARCVLSVHPHPSSNFSTKRLLTCWKQTRGEEKGQGCRILRAQEGRKETVGRGAEERQGRREHQAAAGRLRLLDACGKRNRSSSSRFASRGLHHVVKGALEDVSSLNSHWHALLFLFSDLWLGKNETLFKRKCQSHGSTVMSHGPRINNVFVYQSLFPRL